MRNGRSAHAHALRGQILSLGELPLATVHGPFTAHVGRNLATGAVAFAVARGDVASPEPLLARIHSSCVTSETFGGCDCDCVEQLDAALASIARAGRGVVFYLMQEGRGAGFAAKARDRMLVQASGHRLTTFEAYERMGLERDHRRYEEVGDLCALLGIRAPLALLTNNPDKLAAIREAAGVEIERVVPAVPSPSPWNHHYIAAKSRSGHRLDDPGEAGSASELPEAVRSFEPYALAELPRFVHLATYLLPIRSAAAPAPGPPSWFHLHAYFDLVSRVERVVLAHGAADAPDRLVRVERESLLERFPLAGGGTRKRLWHEAVRRIVAHGAGCVTFLPSIGFDDALRERCASLEPGVALLAHHLRGATVRLIVARGDDVPGDEAEAAGRAGPLLARLGCAVAEPVSIASRPGPSRLAPPGAAADATALGREE